MPSWNVVAVLVLLGSFSQMDAATDGAHALPVVELFTSEGCSSCPPADAVLNAMISKGSVIALAFHVDYWDYLGWHDPWSTPEATMRQRRYVKLLGGDVYTPFAVVNATSGVNGADENAIIQASALVGPQRLGMTLTATWGPLTIDATTTMDHAPTATQICVALVESGLSSHVTAGENAGRTLVHDHVVRAFTTVMLSHGSALVHLGIAKNLILAHAQLIAFATTTSSSSAPGIIAVATLDAPKP